MIGLLQPFVQIAKRQLRRCVEDLLQFHRQMRIALARIGLQIGEIGGERDILNERAVGLVARRRQIDRATRSGPFADLAENLRPESNLCVGF